MENYSHEQIQYQPETGMLFEIYDTDGFFNSKHWHNGLEIIYLIAGGMTLNICESNYMLKPGGFIVVNSKTIHSVICREKGRHLLLQIPYEILEKVYPILTLLSSTATARRLRQTETEIMPESGKLLKSSKVFLKPRETTVIF